MNSCTAGEDRERSVLMFEFHSYWLLNITLNLKYFKVFFKLFFSIFFGLETLASPFKL